MLSINNPTFQLLISASTVGFSGGMRLYLAYLFAGIAPNLTIVIAASFIIYATYTLDRSFVNKEDEINHAELNVACKNIGLFVSIAAIVAGSILFFSYNFFSPPVFPFIVGLLYSKGIPLGQSTFKLKGGCGVKNLVIGITWGGTIGLIIALSGQLIPALIISLYFGAKLFINSAIFDMKDVKGDLAAGIRTLPAVLGEYRLKKLLFVVFLVQHLVFLGAMMTGIIVSYPLVFAYSCISTGVVLFWYTPVFEERKSWIQKRFRNILIDGESTAAVALSIGLSC